MSSALTLSKMARSFAAGIALSLALAYNVTCVSVDLMKKSAVNSRLSSLILLVNDSLLFNMISYDREESTRKVCWCTRALKSAPCVEAIQSKDT